MTPEQRQSLNEWLEEMQGEEYISAKEQEHDYINKRGRDLQNLLQLVLEQVRQSVDLPDINRRIVAQRAVDRDGLRRLLLAFDALDVGDATIPSSDGEPVAILDHLKRLLTAVVDQHEMNERRLTNEFLNWHVDNPTYYLLRAAVERGREVVAITEMVAEKLALLDDASLLFYCEISRDTFNRWLNGRLPHRVVSFESLTRDEVVRGLAELISKRQFEADLELAAVGAVDPRPILPIGVSQAVAWTQVSAGARISAGEALLVGILRDLHPLVVRLLQIDSSSILGLAAGRNAITSVDELGSFTVSNLFKTGFKGIIGEMRRLVRTLTLLERLPNRLEETLWRFKVGTEFRALDIRSDWLKRREEVWFQRLLAQYLTDHSFRCYGTSLGRSRTDLLVRSTPEVVIEAKVYGRSKKEEPTEGGIRKDLVQLQSYMESQPFERRGILWVVNFSDTILIEPREEIAGKLFLSFVNLPKLPPSALSKSLTFERANGTSLLKCVRSH